MTKEEFFKTIEKNYKTNKRLKKLIKFSLCSGIVCDDCEVTTGTQYCNYINLLKELKKFKLAQLLK